MQRSVLNSRTFRSVCDKSSVVSFILSVVVMKTAMTVIRMVSQLALKRTFRHAADFRTNLVVSFWYWMATHGKKCTAGCSVDCQRSAVECRVTVL